MKPKTKINKKTAEEVKCFVYTVNFFFNDRQQQNK